MDDGEVNLSIGNGGWVRVDDPDMPGPLYLRFTQDDAGRWRTREVYLEGEARHVEAADLRNLPLRALETAILAGPVQDRIASRAETPGPDLGTLASYYAHTFGRRAQNWVADSFRSKVSKHKPDPPVKRHGVPPLVPPSNGLTDDFLSHVAAAYSAAVASGKAPAPELALQAGAPVRTVHRWIYTARKRGIMQPGLRGSVHN